MDAATASVRAPAPRHYATFETTAREGTGMRTLRNVRGDGVRVAAGSSRIWRVGDIDNGIEGAGGMTTVALWYWFAHAAEAVS